MQSRPVCKLPAIGLRSLAILSLSVGLGLAPAAEAQPNVRVDSSQQLFAVMCALHAAGYQANVSDANFHPVRARLRAEMLRKQGPAAEALREFYKRHLLVDESATLARYVSFALSVGPPGNFPYLYTRDELPPEVLAIEGFGEVLANFYREADLGQYWKSVQKDYEMEMRRIQVPVQEIIFQTSGYLREIVRPQSGRTFVVYVEPMIGAKTAFRNIGDDYSIILSPGATLPTDEIRHSFLHFLLDPLPIRYKAATNSKRMLLNLAARAPQLPVELKDDFEAFLTECLVKAVELRLRKLKAADAERELAANDASGFVLVRPLYRELEQNFEKAEPAISYYFPDLLRGVKLAEEWERLEKLQFASGTAGTTHPAREAATQPESELEVSLREAERHIAARDGATASTRFEEILGKYPGEPRAIYGLAVASALRNDAERAKTLFQRLLAAKEGGEIKTPVPPLVLAWSHVYLGRIYDLEGSRELATTEYRAALNIPGAPPAALEAARRGLEKSFEVPRPKDAPAPPKP